MTETNSTKRVWPWFVVFLAGMVVMGVAVDVLDIKSKMLANVMMLAPLVLLIPMVRNAMSNARLQGSLGDPARRYLMRMIMVSLAYLGSLFLASELIEKGEEITLIAIALAIIPGVAVSGYFWAIGSLIVEQKDEFQRLLIVRQALIATAIALSLAAIWGFLESFELVQHIDAYWWPVVWFFGLGIGAIVNKVQLGSAGEAL